MEEPGTPVKVTSAKARRLRYARLHEAMALQKSGNDVEAYRLCSLEAQVSQLNQAIGITGCGIPWLTALETTSSEYGFVDAVPSDDISSRIEEAQEEAAKRRSEEIHLGTAEAVDHYREQETDEPTVLDELYCGFCFMLSYACKCEHPALETITCDSCFARKPQANLTELEITHMLRQDPDLLTTNESGWCNTCKAALAKVTLNIVEDGWRVCETCCGIGDQESIEQCQAKDCEVDGFFHARCMTFWPNHRYGRGDDDTEDAYLCVDCTEAGRRPYTYSQDSSLTDDSDVLSSSSSPLNSRCVFSEMD